MILPDRLLGKEFNGYGRISIPNDLDRIVESVVVGYRKAPPGLRGEIIGQVKPTAAAVLSVYGKRMAAMAVRTGTVVPLYSSLIAIALAKMRISDYRNNLINLAAINHAAEILGADPIALVGDIKSLLPEDLIVYLMNFFRRPESGKSLSAMGLRALGEGPDFRYA